MNDPLIWLIIVVLVIFSAFFSGVETSYTSVNRIKLKTQEDDGNKRAGKVLKLLDKYDRLISTILIGNNIVNIAAATLATIFFTKIFYENGSWISTLVMTLIVLTFGEILPKSFAKQHAEGVAKAAYPIIIVLIYIFIPFTFVFSKLTDLLNLIFKRRKPDSSLSEDDLLTIIDEIEEEGIIKPYEKDLISSAIKFDDIEVKDIVTPRKDIVAVDVESDMEEIYQIYYESKFTRLPVYEGSIDNIIGFLHEKDFYAQYLKKNGKSNIKKIMKPVHYVAQDSKISVVFKQFRDKQYHIAVVLDHFDSTLGIITMEDIIEELVGEIFDESDEIFVETKKIDDDTYIATGKEILQDALDIMDISLEDDEEDEVDPNQTINSFVSSKIGKLPTSGDNIMINDKWKLTVISASKKGAKEVEFKRL